MLLIPVSVFWDPQNGGKIQSSLGTAVTFITFFYSVYPWWWNRS